MPLGSLSSEVHTVQWHAGLGETYAATCGAQATACFSCFVLC
jgi:hypothetical protein